MNKILPILFLAFFFSCSNKSVETAPAEEKAQVLNESVILDEEKAKAETAYSIEKATKLDFEKAKMGTPAVLSPDTTNSRKKDGVLQVQTNGKWKSLNAFRDTLNSPDSDDDDIREYKYLGQFKTINKLLVEGYFWEFYECYLVDKNTGRIDTTWTIPSISPDNNMLASLSMSYGLEGLPLGIQVFKIEDGGQKITKYIEINQEEWTPYEFYWETPTTVIIQIIPVEKVLEINGVPKHEDYSYIRLRIN